MIFGSPHYKLCQSCPLNQMGVDSLHRHTMGKHSNINISKVSKRILIKLNKKKYHLAVGKVAYCFGADRTGTLVAMTTYTF